MPRKILEPDSQQYKALVSRINNTRPEATLRIKHPELYKHALRFSDYPEISIYNASFGSMLFICYLCDCGQEFDESTTKTVQKGKVACPVCANRDNRIKQMQSCPEEQKVKNAKPELLKFGIRSTKYPTLDLGELSIGSTTLFLWKCECGKEFESKVLVRATAKHPTLCMECIHLRKLSANNRRKLRPDNEKFAYVYPELAKAVINVHNSDMKLEDLSIGSSELVDCICPCGKVFSSTILARTKAKNVYCRSCKLTGKSLFEFQLQKLLETSLDIEVRTHYSKNRDIPEVDLYLPSLDIAIQLDPYYHHRNKQVQDARNHARQQELYTKVLRIREEPLPPIPNSISITKNAELKDWLNSIIENIGLPVKLLSEVDYKEAAENATVAWDDSINYVERNLTQHPYYSHFVKNLNRPTRRPEATGIGSRDICLWRCEHGHEQKTSPRRKQGCKECYRTTRRVPKQGASFGDKYPLGALEFVENLSSPELGPFDVRPNSVDVCVWKCSKCEKHLKSSFNVRAWFFERTKPENVCRHRKLTLV